MGFLWNKWCSGLLRKASPANRISSWAVSSQLLCHVKEAGIQGFQVYFKIEFVDRFSVLLLKYTLFGIFLGILGKAGKLYEKFLFRRSLVKKKINWYNFFWHTFSHCNWLRHPLTWEWWNSFDIERITGPLSWQSRLLFLTSVSLLHLQSWFSGRLSGQTEYKLFLFVIFDVVWQLFVENVPEKYCHNIFQSFLSKGLWNIYDLIQSQ